MAIPRMPCRGENVRRQICENYNIIPRGHFRILNGIIIQSDAGDELTNEYFIFELINKNDSDDIYNIFCGTYAAHSFQRLAKLTLPPIFNPLREINQNNNHNRQHNNYNLNEHHDLWNKERKQLLNIVLLTLSWLGEIDTNKALFNIKTELENPAYIGYYPKRLVKSVNTALKNLNTTFEDIIDDLSCQNDLRNFAYNDLLNYMEKNNYDDYITKKS